MPTEHDIWAIGGPGTSADENDNNGGAFFDSGNATWATFQTATAGPLFHSDAVTAAGISTGVITQISITGIGTASVVDAYVNIIWGTGGDLVDDRYRVLAINDADTISIDYDTSAGTGPTGDDTELWVGGALTKTDTGFQTAVNNYSQGDRIGLAQGNHAIAATVLINNTSGTAAERMYIRGVDKSDGSLLNALAGDTLPVLIAKAVLANGVIHLSGDSDYHHLSDFEINCDNKAAYGINSYDADCDAHWYENIVIHNATSHGIYTRVYAVQMFCVNSYDNSGDGIWITSVTYYGMLDGCTCSGNGGSGIYINGAAMAIVSCECYNNTSSGIDCDSTADSSKLIGNVCYHNGASGIRIDTLSNNMVIVNNDIVQLTGDGACIDFDGNSAQTFLRFSNNNAYHADGDANLSTETADAASWIAYGDGDNTNVNSAFADAANGDFGSAVQGAAAAGYPPVFLHEGDPVTNYQAIGAVTPLNVGTSADNIRTGESVTIYGAATNGNYVPATEADVEATVQYGASGIEFTGTFAVPLEADVEAGVTYGGGGTEYTGTFTAPAEADVQSGVTYGGGGVEYTGTFTEPGIGNVLSGVTYGGGGTEFTGTYAAIVSPGWATIGSPITGAF